MKSLYQMYEIVNTSPAYKGFIIATTFLSVEVASFFLSGAIFFKSWSGAVYKL